MPTSKAIGIVAGAAKGEKGGAVIEGALVLPVLLLVNHGVRKAGTSLQFRRPCLSRSGTLRLRAWLGERQSGDPSPAHKPGGHWAVGLDTTKVTVTPTWSPNAAPGSTVSVQVQYNYQAMLGTYILKNSVNVSSASSSVIFQ